MGRKLGISKSEMLQMREQGLSNRDIAKCLDIHYATVYNWIGPQGGHVENLAAFNDPVPVKEEVQTEERKAPSKAVDSIEMIYEIVKSADGTFRAELDYENKCVSVFDTVIDFGQLAELATFVIGLVGRVDQKTN